jgi:aminopeptidase N
MRPAGAGPLSVISYDVSLDLASSPREFWSRSEICFSCAPSATPVAADLHAKSVSRVTLNGEDMDPSLCWRPGRLEVGQLEGRNVLTVEARFDYATAGGGLTGQGLYSVTDPVDGSTCVYSKAYRGGASRIYCCFDRPSLRAPMKFSVQVPAGWSCLTNAPIAAEPPGQRAGGWRFTATAPISPGVSSICAGPYRDTSLSCEREQGGSLPVRLLAGKSAARSLQPGRIQQLIQQPLRYYERNLGVPFPYPKCDLLFVPGFPGLAFSAPGLIAVREEVLSSARAGKSSLWLPMVIAHELTHAWIGGFTNICSADVIDMWLIEALATYLSRTALAETMADALAGEALWDGPVAAGLPDHGYAGNAAVIRELDLLIGRDAVLAGLGSFLRRHPHGQATRDDLVDCWSQHSGRDLRDWSAARLHAASPH